MSGPSLFCRKGYQSRVIIIHCERLSTRIIELISDISTLEYAISEAQDSIDISESSGLGRLGLSSLFLKCLKVYYTIYLK